MDFLEYSFDIARGLERQLPNISGTKEAREVVSIGADGTPTEKIDKIAEDYVLSRLKELNLPLRVVSEESGVIDFSGSPPEYICILDPIDGSYNAGHGIPFYCISIAFAVYKEDAKLNDVETALIYNLATGDYFSARKGRSAEFNGERIGYEKPPSIDKWTLILYTNKYRLNQTLNLLKKIKKVRALGSVSLEMGYTARGDFEAILDNRDYLRVVDIAAGYLIVKETGGTVTDLEGREINISINQLSRTNILAVRDRKMLEGILAEL